MALATAHVPGQLSSLAEPVTFTGADANALLEELSHGLSDDTLAYLRESVSSATAAMSGRSANSLFE
jgi:hypothetical protein